LSELSILLGCHCCDHQPNLLSLIIIIFKGTRFHKINNLLAWRTIIKNVNWLVVPNNEGHELFLDLNLTQLAKHKEPVRRRMCPWLEFEHITRLWHWRLGANARFLVLVLEVEPAINGELKIFYEGIYQGDEIVVLVWSTKLGLSHYRWLHGLLFHILVDHKVELFVCTIHHIWRFLQI
jgi:hypothetical protein